MDLVSDKRCRIAHHRTYALQFDQIELGQKTGWIPRMFKQGIRQLTTMALRSTDLSTSYSIRVSQAQGVVNSLTGG
jgi:hypothetical protein